MLKSKKKKSVLAHVFNLKLKLNPSHDHGCFLMNAVRFKCALFVPLWGFSETWHKVRGT